MPTISPFSAAHAEGVFNLILPIQQQEFGVPITRADQPDLADIPGFYQRGAGNFWVALDTDQRVVGSIALLDIGQGDAALRKMFVAATHRGAAHGVADHLLQTLLAWARGRDLRKIYLGTTDKFLAAHRFYAKQGFDEIPRAALPPSFPVMAVDSKFFARVP
jgi:N-acetylglutamate synthase-like GNAT family acetyltransferase